MIISYSSTMDSTSSTDSLKPKIEAAMARIPSAHRLAPVEDEEVNDLDVGYHRLQDYAFTQGVALAIISKEAKRKRMTLDCTRHKTRTTSTRKIEEKNRQRVSTSAPVIVAID